MRTTKAADLAVCPDCTEQHTGGPCGQTLAERKASWLDRMRGLTVDYHPSATIDRSGRGHSTRRGGAVGQRKFDARSNRLAGLASQGIVPDNSSTNAMIRADAISQATGKAYDGAARGRELSKALGIGG